MKLWVNYTGMQSQEARPNRVRLDDGTTRTAEEITDEMLAAAGWFQEEPTSVTDLNAPEPQQ
jgi:hypothetical protein